MLRARLKQAAARVLPPRLARRSALPRPAALACARNRSRSARAKPGTRSQIPAPPMQRRICQSARDALAGAELLTLNRAQLLSRSTSVRLGFQGGNNEVFAEVVP